MSIVQSNQVAIALIGIVFTALSAWWSLRALWRGEMNIGRTQTIMVRRDRNPIQFWIWMTIQLLGTALFGVLSIALLVLPH